MVVRAVFYMPTITYRIERRLAISNHRGRCAEHCLVSVLGLVCGSRVLYFIYRVFFAASHAAASCGSVMSRRVWVDAQRPRLLVGTSTVVGMSNAPVSGPFRLALACTTKRPTNFLTWLHYHTEIAGVEHFFLRIEETPALEILLAFPPWDEMCTVSPARGSTVRDWKEQSDRQNAHVAQSITQARRCGYTHLLHIDDDEL